MMGRKISFILLISCALSATASMSQPLRAGAGQLDVPTPTITDEPTYTIGAANVIYWQRIVHPDLTAYRIQASLSPSFDSVWRVQVVRADWVSTEFTGLPADTMYYRVQAAYTPAADTFWSAWSEVTFSIQDVTPPLAECWLGISGEWSTLDTFTLFYHVEDPAGVESIYLYLRTDESNRWDSVYQTISPAGAPSSYDGEWHISTADFAGDAMYEFYIGARDDAKAKDWYVGDARKSGNVDIPQPDVSPMCSLMVDTHLPQSQIDATFRQDSLRTSKQFDIPYSANDPTTPSGFNSGLDSLYLYWAVDSGAIDPTAPVANLPFDHVVILETPGGADSVGGAYPFTAPFDTSIYYFYTSAVDVAGNRQEVVLLDTLRVFTDLRATLTLFDPDDPDDSEYTSGCQVTAVTDFNVPAVDSLMLCDDEGHCTVYDALQQRPVTSSWTFTDCSDGIKHLYVTVWADGKAATASDSNVIDTQRPVLSRLTLYDLSSADRDYTDVRPIGVEYSGSDQPFSQLQWLVLSEDAAFASADTFDISLTHGDVQFELSPEIERKTVYGYLVDRAENESGIRAASIMLFERAHNYPNPFNPDGEITNLVFTSTREQQVTISIYDLFGNLVYEREATASAGLNDGINDAALQWDGRNMQGAPVAGGGYICVLTMADGEETKHKIAVIR